MGITLHFLRRIGILSGLLVMLCCVLRQPAWADSVQLITGEKYEGTIEKVSEIFIRIKVTGDTQEYQEFLLEQIGNYQKGQDIVNLHPLEIKAPPPPPVSLETTEKSAKVEVKPEVKVEAEETVSTPATIPDTVVQQELNSNSPPAKPEVIVMVGTPEPQKEEPKKIATTVKSVDLSKKKEVPVSTTVINPYAKKTEPKVVYTPAVPTQNNALAPAPTKPGADNKKKQLFDVAKLREYVALYLKIIVGFVLLSIVVGIASIVSWLIFKPKLIKAHQEEVAQKIAEIQKDTQMLPGEKKKLEDDVNKPWSPLHMINEKNYWLFVGQIFVYPLTTKVIFATIAVSILFGFISMAVLIPFYGWLAALIVFPYFLGCNYTIIQSSVGHVNEDGYEWPDFLSFFENIGIAIMIFLTGVVAGLPAGLYMYFFHRPDWIFFGLVLMVLILQPMYMLVVVLVGGFASLNIVKVWQAIFDVFVPYMLTVLFLWILQTLSVLVVIVSVTFIPYVGNFLQWFIAIYFTFANMRLLGLFYRAHRFKLGWMSENV